MIEIRGTREEIAAAISGIAPKYPTDLIKHLDPGEWRFIIAGIDVRVLIPDVLGTIVIAKGE